MALTCFTFNIAVGITAGFVLYPLCKLTAGKRREIRSELWRLTALSVLFFGLLSMQVII
jgi:AGZA family xanthine/uracil permease-like MFS transporter